MIFIFLIYIVEARERERESCVVQKKGERKILREHVVPAGGVL